MSTPNCKRFFRNCDEFNLCINIGDSNYILEESPDMRYTVFYYAVYGRGEIKKIDGSKNLIIESGVLTDVHDYLNHDAIFESSEDFYLIGFNTLDKNIKWDAELLTPETNNLTIEKPESFLICLNGEVTVNDKKFKRYSYAKIFAEREYTIDMNENSVLCLFSKKDTST
jgi:hypothetical protein